MDVSDVDVFPMPNSGHPLCSELLVRTLRLNSQTNAYAAIWAELYESTWSRIEWAVKWAGLASLAEGVDPVWTRDTPLRTERARRAAMVELDALVAVWLGIEADALVAMYHARFPVLRQYDEKMWFDAAGRRIAYAPSARGYGQSKDAWKQLTSHDDFPREASVPTGYDGPLRRADREAEMRAAHAEFTRRMHEAGWVPGATKAGLSEAAGIFDPSDEHRESGTSSSEQSHTTGGGSAS